MQVTGRKILFIEDNEELAGRMKAYFSVDNEVQVANCKSDAEELIKNNGYDIIILDIILPDGSGMDLLSIDRILPPVIILSDLGTEDDVIDGLQSGATDYIVKPCSMRLLETKMALRLLPDNMAKLEYNGLILNLVSRTAEYKGTAINFTSSEFNILYFLMSNRGSFYTSDEIYKEVWHAEPMGTVTIRKHISSMRRKLIEYTQIEFILTNFGKGYCFIGGGKKLTDENEQGHQFYLFKRPTACNRNYFSSIFYSYNKFCHNRQKHHAAKA